MGVAVTEGDVLVVALALTPVAELADVTPRREGSTFGAPEDAVDVVARVELFERCPELALHVVAHRVELLRPVEREHREMTVVVDAYLTVGHHWNLGRSAPAIDR